MGASTKLDKEILSLSPQNQKVEKIVCIHSPQRELFQGLGGTGYALDVQGFNNSFNSVGFSSLNPYQISEHSSYSKSQLLLPISPFEANKDLVFLDGDYNQDGYSDLFVIAKKGIGTSSTEIYVLDGSSNYQTWLLRTGTILHETSDNFDFGVGDYNRDKLLDVYAIKKSGTSTQSTEIHVLDGRTNYQSWLAQISTPLHETGDNFDFEIQDYNRDGTPDIFAIKKFSPDAPSAEIYVLDGRTMYFLMAGI